MTHEPAAGRDMSTRQSNSSKQYKQQTTSVGCELRYWPQSRELRYWPQSRPLACLSIAAHHACRHYPPGLRTTTTTNPRPPPCFQQRADARCALRARRAGAYLPRRFLVMGFAEGSAHCHRQPIIASLALRTSHSHSDVLAMAMTTSYKRTEDSWTQIAAALLAQPGPSQVPSRHSYHGPAENAPLDARVRMVSGHDVHTVQRRRLF